MYYHLWILVADRGRARFFSRARPSGGIHLIDEIFHPEGRMKEHEINSDRPGRAFHTADVQRSGYSPPVSPTTRIAMGFAGELASRLDQGRAQNQYERLVLVADPKMLGLIKDALNPQTASRVIKVIDKNFSYQSDLEVIRFLNENLRTVDRELGLSHAL